MFKHYIALASHGLRQAYNIIHHDPSQQFCSAAVVIIELIYNVCTTFSKVVKLEHLWFGLLIIFCGTVHWS